MVMAGRHVLGVGNASGLACCTVVVLSSVLLALRPACPTYWPTLDIKTSGGAMIRFVRCWGQAMLVQEPELAALVRCLRTVVAQRGLSQQGLDISMPSSHLPQTHNTGLTMHGSCGS